MQNLNLTKLLTDNILNFTVRYEINNDYHNNNKIDTLIDKLNETCRICNRLGGSDDPDRL